jgi:uncharacterized protein YfaS (alpha-2-macroglobulin family)
MAVSVPKYYDKGDMVSLNAQFYKKDGTPGDPTSVILKIKDPTGVQLSPTAVRTDVGSFFYDLATDLMDPTGRWEYRFEGTGAVQTVEEGAFFLRETDFT